jgi:magnesium chelatase family protein
VAKRALKAAAAGEHNCLMSGAPARARRCWRALPGILPNLAIEEALEATRPFHALHHTISHAGLIGGGKLLLPGKVTLAQRGVLFLDELPE